MAASEDELAKRDVQEAVWTWAGRILVLAVTFGFGLFTGYVTWGAGTEGAPALRKQVEVQAGQILELKNKRVDLEGQITVLQGRMAELQKVIANRPATPPPAPPQP